MFTNNIKIKKIISAALLTTFVASTAFAQWDDQDQNKRIKNLRKKINNISAQNLFNLQSNSESMNNIAGRMNSAESNINQNSTDIDSIASQLTQGLGAFSSFAESVNSQFVAQGAAVSALSGSVNPSNQEHLTFSVTNYFTTNPNPLNIFVYQMTPTIDFSGNCPNNKTFVRLEREAIHMEVAGFGQNYSIVEDLAALVSVVPIREYALYNDANNPNRPTGYHVLARPIEIVDNNQVISTFPTQTSNITASGVAHQDKLIKIEYTLICQ